MEPVKGEVTAPSGVSGEGSVFAINHNADNALITLRYRLKDADIQIAEEPFEAGGTKFARGSFIISKRVAGRSGHGDERARPQGPCARGRAVGQTHPARAARVAILHGWTSTQTEGWWRQAFDIYKIPYDYIDPQTVRDTANLRAKYDVIVFGPGRQSGARCRGCRCGATRSRTATRPRRRTSAPGRRPTTRASGWDSRGCAPAGVHRRRRRVPRRRTAAPSSRSTTLHLRRQPRAGRAPARAWSDRCCARGWSTTRARSSTAFPTTSRCTATAATPSPSAPTSAAAGRGGGGGGGGRRGRRPRRRPGPPDRPRHAGRSRRRPGPRRRSKGSNLTPLPRRRRCSPGSTRSRPTSS